MKSNGIEIFEAFSAVHTPGDCPSKCDKCIYLSREDCSFTFDAFN